MDIIKYIITYFILLFIEKTFIHLLSIKNITPDLILIFVIIISLREEKSKSTGIGFFAGFFQDVFTTSFLGLSALTKSLIGFFGVFFQQSKKKYTISYFISIVLLLAFLHELLYQFIYNLGSQLGFFHLIYYYAIPRTLYTSVLAAMIFIISKSFIWKTDNL